ncbi:50S ribosomal protein L21 [Anaplasma centrale str. Israel]|uniref:Large ribosomal subunit protein bL21 n=1 Tax=Anaplasma centrale (strain Israel) TaxID=574556 RepID=D1AUQ1_ANACI|nr:50S ribosomal protein L21 [Anaplasma centrale]ACZ49279.1 50S ribosomal protein L21 [Anaplasma centrale str. Israel]
MFAVVEAGGKQYKVKERDVIKVELMNVGVGEQVMLDSLATFGGEESPVFQRKSSSVTAEVVSCCRGDKIVVFKKRRRKNYRRKIGHRQELVVLRVLKVG